MRGAAYVRGVWGRGRPGRGLFADLWPCLRFAWLSLVWRCVALTAILEDGAVELIAEAGEAAGIAVHTGAPVAQLEHAVGTPTEPPFNFDHDRLTQYTLPLLLTSLAIHMAFLAMGRELTNILASPTLYTFFSVIIGLALRTRRKHPVREDRHIEGAAVGCQRELVGVDELEARVDFAVEKVNAHVEVVRQGGLEWQVVRGVLREDVRRLEDAPVREEHRSVLDPVVRKTVD